MQCSLAALQQNSVRGLMVHLREREGRELPWSGVWPAPTHPDLGPNPLQETNLPAIQRGVPAWLSGLLTPSLSPPSGKRNPRTCAERQGGFPAAPGWGRPIPTTGIASTKGPLRDRPRAGGPTSRGGLRIKTGGGKGQNHHTSAPKPSPYFPQLTILVLFYENGSCSKTWVL